MTPYGAVAAVKGIVLVSTDDDRGAGLRAALAERPELVVLAEVAGPHEAVAFARRYQPGVVVLDVGIEAIAGHAVLKSIREVAPTTRIVLHAWDAEVSEAPGRRRWVSHQVSMVLDPDRAAALEARLVLPHGPRGVPVARSFTSDLLAQWDLDGYVDPAGLLASELVANAVLHVQGPCALELTHRADVLRVAVADAGLGMPDLKAVDPSTEGGRGLHIVSALSSAWGVDHVDDGGKLVWAELDHVGTRVS